MAQVEERVSELEQLFKDLLFSQNRAMTSINQLSTEMIEFKNEMREFEKNIAKDTKQFKESSLQDTKELKKKMNKKWGDLANKMGTVVEDLILPNFHIMLKEYLNLPEPDDVMIRRRKKIKSKNIKKEFDLIAVYYDKNLIFLNETKSTAKRQYVEEFTEVY